MQDSSEEGEKVVKADTTVPFHSIKPMGRGEGRGGERRRGRERGREGDIEE